MNRPWGQPCYGVCWLVEPTKVDLHLPDDHTIEYRLYWPYEFGRPGDLILATIDREEAATKSAELYRLKHRHQIKTVWRDPSGEVVKKLDVIRARKQIELFGDDS